MKKNNAKKVFVGHIVKTIGEGMAHILYNKGKTVYVVKAGKIGHGIPLDPVQDEKWGRGKDAFKKEVAKAKEVYGKVEFRYAVSL